MWQHLAHQTICTYGDINIVNFDKNSLSKIIKHIKNDFWKEVFTEISKIQTNEEFMSLNFLNFLSLNEIESFLPWFRSGMKNMKDIFTDAGELETFENLKVKYNLKGTYLLYFKLIKSIPKHWIDLAKREATIISNDKCELFNDIMKSNDCKCLY